MLVRSCVRRDAVRCLTLLRVQPGRIWDDAAWQKEWQNGGHCVSAIHGGENHEQHGKPGPPAQKPPLLAGAEPGIAAPRRVKFKESRVSYNLGKSGRIPPTNGDAVARADDYRARREQSQARQSTPRRPPIMSLETYQRVELQGVVTRETSTQLKATQNEAYAIFHAQIAAARAGASKSEDNELLFF